MSSSLNHVRLLLALVSVCSAGMAGAQRLRVAVPPPPPRCMEDQAYTGRQRPAVTYVQQRRRQQVPADLGG